MDEPPQRANKKIDFFIIIYSDKHVNDVLDLLCFENTAARLLILEQLGDLGQKLEMRSGVAGRGYGHNEYSGRLLIHGIKIDTLDFPADRRDQFFHLIRFSMGYGDSVLHPSRHLVLAKQDGLKHRLTVRNFSGRTQAVHHLGNDPILRIRIKIKKYCIHSQQFF